MADELARINLLQESQATLETITEEGTPGIATDYGHRLGWLSGGLFRWAALRDAAERFASVVLSNIAEANRVVMTDSLGKLVASPFRQVGSEALVDLPLKIEGRLVNPPSYAGIYLDGEGATPQSIPTGAAYTKITPFTTNDAEEWLSSADSANDKIIIGRDGQYSVTFDRSYTVGTVNVVWHVGVAVNGTIIPKTVRSIKNTTTGTLNYASLTTKISCLAGDEVDIRVRHDNAGSISLTYEHAELFCHAID